jgi:hypothetical protein
MNPYWKLLVVDDDYDGENAQKIEQPNWTKKQLNVKSFGISQGWCYRVSWLRVKLWEGYNSMTCTMLADQDVYTSKQLFLLPPPPPPLHKDSIFNSKKNSSWSQLSDLYPRTPLEKRETWKYADQVHVCIVAFAQDWVSFIMPIIYHESVFFFSSSKSFNTRNSNL